MRETQLCFVVRGLAPTRPPSAPSPLRRDHPAPAQDEPPALPGSDGEHRLQEAVGSRERADRFYRDQLRDRLLPKMIEFINRMEMVFIATADASGECDASLRAGTPGFLRVLDDRTLAYPEYRGNGVMASLGNISENPHIGRRRDELRDGYRSFPVGEYLILYRVGSPGVLIMHVLHGRRNLDEIFRRH